MRGARRTRSRGAAHAFARLAMPLNARGRARSSMIVSLLSPHKWRMLRVGAGDRASMDTRQAELQGRRPCSQVQVCTLSRGVRRQAHSCEHSALQVVSSVCQAASLVPQEFVVASIDDMEASQALIGHTNAALDAGYLCGRWLGRSGAYECTCRLAR